jgi:hypothetical protein
MPETDVLKFNLNYKVVRKVRKGFLGLRSTTEDFVVLNNGNYSPLASNN